MDTLTSLFLAKRRYLARIAYNVLYDSDEVEDILQDAFLKLWERRDQLRFTAELKCFMSRMVYRLSLDCMQRKRTRERFAKHADEGLVDVIPESKLTDFVPRALLFVKGERSRQIMAKLFQDGKTQEETAEEMGITLQYVRNVSCESMKVLREKLKRVYE